MATLNVSVNTNRSRPVSSRKRGEVSMSAIRDSYDDMPENCVPFEKFENEFFCQLRKRYGKIESYPYL